MSGRSAAASHREDYGWWCVRSDAGALIMRGLTWECSAQWDTTPPRRSQAARSRCPRFIGSPPFKADGPIELSTRTAIEHPVTLRVNRLDFFVGWGALLKLPEYLTSSAIRLGLTASRRTQQLPWE